MGFDAMIPWSENCPHHITQQASPKRRSSSSSRSQNAHGPSQPGAAQQFTEDELSKAVRAVMAAIFLLFVGLSAGLKDSMGAVPLSALDML